MTSRHEFLGAAMAMLCATSGVSKNVLHEPSLSLEGTCGLAWAAPPDDVPWVLSILQNHTPFGFTTLGGRRFWRASLGTRVQSIKAREDAALNSSIVFELPKGVIVAQADSCKLMGGILRLPVLKPPSFNATDKSSSDALVGWVTLTAENKGGPRFFEEVPVEEIDTRAESFGLSNCPKNDRNETRRNQASRNVRGQVTRDDLSVESEQNTSNACTVVETDFLYRASGRVINCDAVMWGRLAEQPYNETLWLVLAFTPWCAPCVDALAAWQKLARRSVGTKTSVVAINCYVEKVLCEELSIFVHPLMSAHYFGHDTSVIAAISSWTSLRPQNNFALPTPWTFIGTAQGGLEASLAPLLSALPVAFKPCGDFADEKDTTPLMQAGCKTDVAQRPGISTTVEDEAARSASQTDIASSGAHASQAGFTFTLSTVSSSLSMGLRDFLSIRQLASLELWLRAVSSRAQQINIRNQHGTALAVVSEAFVTLHRFVVTELSQSLAASGASVVCSASWEHALAPLLKAVAEASSVAALRDGFDPDLWASSLFHGLPCIDGLEKDAS